MKNPAKEYLESIKTLDITIKSIERRIDELEAKTVNLGGITYDKVNVQTSYRNSQEDAILRKYDMENSKRLEDLKARFNVRYRLIVMQISMLESNLHKQILMMKYVQYKEIPEIARELHYAKDTIANEHGKALAAFRDKYLICERRE